MNPHDFRKVMADDDGNEVHWCWRCGTLQETFKDGVEYYAGGVEPEMNHGFAFGTQTMPECNPVAPSK